jgi:predicted signal transduction protein with EAL and GGDEF domain
MRIATYPSDARDGSELIRSADRAMYVAKARGKNQIHLHGDDRRSLGGWLEPEASRAAAR